VLREASFKWRAGKDSRVPALNSDGSGGSMKHRQLAETRAPGARVQIQSRPNWQVLGRVLEFAEKKSTHWVALCGGQVQRKVLCVLRGCGLYGRRGGRF
jgi:hypothetical protein